MSVKKITVVAALMAFAFSAGLSAFALTLEEVKASQGAKVNSVLQSKYTEQDIPTNPKTSEEFGIPSITFKEVNQSKGVVVVFAWAKWCRPCISKISLIKEIGREFGAKIKLRAYDSDIKDPDSPYFKDIPTALLYKNGEIVGIYGVAPESMIFIKGAINYILKNPVIPAESSAQFAGDNRIYNLPYMDDAIYKAQKEKSGLIVIYAYKPEKEHKQLTSFLIKVSNKNPDVMFYRYDLTKNSTLNHDFYHNFIWDYGVVLMKNGKVIRFIQYPPTISANLEQMISLEK